MKYGGRSEYILGVTASTSRVSAVLVHERVDGPVILRTFSRARAGSDFSQMDPAPSDAAVNSGSDFSFNMPESESADSSLFLASEFGVDNSGSGDTVSAGIPQTDFSVPLNGPVPFDLELMEILSECVAAGYESPRIVFALGSEHVHTVQLNVSEESDKSPGTDKKKKKKKSKSGGVSREKLFELLTASQAGRYDEKKTAFLPMMQAPDAMASRLAVFAQSFEPITPSLRAIRDRKRNFPSVALMDNEITLLTGLLKAGEMELTQGDDPMDRTTLMVRVGSDDTLVIFLAGNELLHVESLRSITAFDPPETICSRVLLLQDELGRSDADRIYLFSDDRENTLFESFSQFFESTDIRFLRNLLPTMEEERKKPLSRDEMLCVVATLRLVQDELLQASFPEVNFLDEKLAGRQFQLPFSWPVAAMIVILFGSTLFFVAKYFDQNHALEMYRYELKNYPQEVIEANLDDLETRIDSLQMRSQGFIGSLNVLDSLLVGSDKWSRTMERLARHTDSVDGLWIERWSEGSGMLKLEGSATSRDQVVAFAAEADAIIESLTFSDIRDWPVFSFVMQIRMEDELPEAAIYLRNRAEQEPDALLSATFTEEAPTSQDS